MKFLSLLLFLSFFLSPLVHAKRATLGSLKNPIKMALVPGQDAGVLQSNGNELAQFLKTETGHEFSVLVPNNFVAVVESLGTSRTDMALINSFGYLLAEKKFGSHVRLVGVNKGKTDYWGQIITAKPEIKKIEDLQGKKIAYVDPASTSGFVLPSSLFQERKIKIGEILFAGKHDSVVTAVYTGKVDAGATFHMPEGEDARRLVKTQFPDVFEKVRILELTGPIPGDPVIFRKDLPKDIEDSIVKALLKYGKTERGPVVLHALYNITNFQETSAKKYEKLRQILQKIGKSPEDFLK